MKKSLARKITLSILAGAVLMSSSVVWAGETVDVAPPGNGWIGIDVDSNSSIDIYAPQNSYNNSMASYSHNEVTLSTGTDYSFAGGYYGTGYGDSRGNNIKISSAGTFNGAIYGGYATQGGAFSNTVVIEGGKFNGNIYGGYSKQGKAGDLDNGNSVTINAGDFGNNIYGGYSDQGDATNNSVVISGGKFLNSGGSSFIHGGRARNDATGNSVTISGGTFGENNTSESIVNIVGGYSYESDKKSNNNTVSISGNANLAYAKLYGGLEMSDKVKYGGADTPNTLNIGTNSKMYKGNVYGIAGFDVIKFESIDWKKDEVGNTDNYVIKVGTLELNDTKVTVGNVRVAGNTTLTAGDDMTLIQADAMSTPNNGANNQIKANQKVTIYKGVAQTVEADVKQDNTKIYLEIAGSGSVTVEEDSETNPNSGGVPGSSELNPQVLVIGESRTAATAFTNQGSELIETGLDALARDNSKDTKVFAAVYGNHSEYETGSHVNVNGWSGIVGVGKTNANGLTVGAFFENGDGNYSTHNVTDFGYLRGDGEAVYNGGGFLVRKDNASGVYTEASLRAGNLKNELRGAVIGSQGEMGYDIDTFYYGVHVGIGKVIPRSNDGDSIDVYGKFIYTHHDSENFKIDGDEFHFDSVDSERLRLGFRINEVQTNKLAMYYGAAWEYEFGGDADNTVVGYDLSTPSLGGSTVIGEIGAHYKASDKWSIDLNGRAYTGQREGFSGSVQANYSF